MLTFKSVQAPKVGEGLNRADGVHVEDLARAYTYILNDIKKDAIVNPNKPWNGYYFSGTEEYQSWFFI